MNKKEIKGTVIFISIMIIIIFIASLFISYHDPKKIEVEIFYQKRLSTKLYSSMFYGDFLGFIETEVKNNEDSCIEAHKKKVDEFYNTLKKINSKLN